MSVKGLGVASKKRPVITEEDRAIGRRIAELRTVLGLNQTDFGRGIVGLVGGPGIGQSEISGWERGSPFNRHTLAAIALLHIDNPHGCLLWLRGMATTMPEIRPRMPPDASSGAVGAPVTPKPRPIGAGAQVLEEIERQTAAVRKSQKRQKLG